MVCFDGLLFRMVDLREGGCFCIDGGVDGGRFYVCIWRNVWLIDVLVVF